MRDDVLQIRKFGGGAWDGEGFVPQLLAQGGGFLPGAGIATGVPAVIYFALKGAVQETAHTPAEASAIGFMGNAQKLGHVFAVPKWRDKLVHILPRGLLQRLFH